MEKARKAPSEGAPASSGQATSTGTSNAKKERSPNYPAVGLGGALRMAKKIYDAEKKSPMTPELAAKHLGYGSMSGPARVAVSVLKKFGLLSEEGPKRVRITDEAVKILVYPESHPERQQLLARAAMKPEIYKELVAKYGGELASDDNLKGYLVADRGFSDAAATVVIKGIRETVGIANLGNTVNTPTEELDETDMLEEQEQKPPKIHAPGVPIKPTGPTGAPAYVLPLGAEQTVSIYATAPMTSTHIELLTKVLALFKDTAKSP